MRKFTEVLEEYLTERERQNGKYYDGLQIERRMEGRWYMDDLARELDEMIQGVEE